MANPEREETFDVGSKIHVIEGSHLAVKGRLAKSLHGVGMTAFFLIGDSSGARISRWLSSGARKRTKTPTTFFVT
jgi:hypothetical protein